MGAAMSKPVKSEDFDRYVKETAGYERDYLGEVARSRTLAWRVATGGALLGVLGFAFGVYGNHRVPPPPVVLSVDNATGSVSVLSVLEDAKASYGVAEDEHNINQFILLRESYDWNTIQADYNAMGLFASPSVIAEYEALYNDTDGLQVKLANRAHVATKVAAITLGDGTSTATVRFTTQVIRDSGISDPVKHWIATLAYHYVNAKMTVEQRRANPLGFQVTSYRVDPEIVR